MSEETRRTLPVMNVARELCLGVQSFRDGAGLDRLLADDGRRIVLLNKGDIRSDSVAAVRRVAVCAEGVEDFGTCEFLKTIECDRMQGFLISEAVLPEDIRGSYRANGEADGVPA